MLYLPREEGQGLVEYALILVLVAIVVIVILALLGPAIGNTFSGMPILSACTRLLPMRQKARSVKGNSIS